MKKYICLAFIISSYFCVSQTNLDDYYSSIKQLKTKQTKLGQQPITDIVLKQTSSDLYETLTDKIFPTWYRTTWDFNGISNVPGEGEIACGYFVSTTLKHVGFNLNRYKLAQQASEVIAKSICGTSNTTTITDNDLFYKYLEQYDNEILVVGIDFHVGFIVIKNKTPYFVHSDFINGEVVSELVENSEALNAASIYVIGKITNNDTLMKKWIKKTKIY